MGFTKLDERILQSSIMAEDPKTFKVWIALLAACRENGVAYTSTVYLQAICHMTETAVTHAIERLSSPDAASRSLADEGRRIRRVDGGFEIINYTVYREASVRDIEAERKRVYREKKEGCPGQSRTVQGRSASASASDLFSKFLNTLTQADKDAWKVAYPACDIDLEIAKSMEWVKANPAKGRKSNWRKFLNGWLARTQDSGGTKNGSGKPDRLAGVKEWANQRGIK
jgi:hypothetical protein